jgi:hypothetical protein
MKLLKIVAASAAFAVSTAALAFHCPADMQKIDAALTGNPPLSKEQLAEVKKLRAEGETLHNEGKHTESVEKLGQAMAILGI